MVEHLTRRVPIVPGSFNAGARTFEVSLGAPVARPDGSIEILSYQRDWPSGVPLLGLRAKGGILGRVVGFTARGHDTIAIVRLASGRALDDLVADIESGVVNALNLRFTAERWSSVMAGDAIHRGAKKWSPRSLTLAPALADAAAVVEKAPGPKAAKPSPTEIKQQQPIEAAPKRGFAISVHAPQAQPEPSSAIAPAAADEKAVQDPRRARLLAEVRSNIARRRTRRRAEVWAEIERRRRLASDNDEASASADDEPDDNDPDGRIWNVAEFERHEAEADARRWPHRGPTWTDAEAEAALRKAEHDYWRPRFIP